LRLDDNEMEHVCEFVYLLPTLALKVRFYLYEWL